MLSRVVRIQTFTYIEAVRSGWYRSPAVVPLLRQRHRQWVFTCHCNTRGGCVPEKCTEFHDPDWVFPDGLCIQSGSSIQLTSSSSHTMHNSNITGPDNDSYLDDQPGKKIIGNLSAIKNQKTLNACPSTCPWCGWWLTCFLFITCSRKCVVFQLVFYGTIMGKAQLHSEKPDDGSRIRFRGFPVRWIYSTGERG